MKRLPCVALFAFASFAACGPAGSVGEPVASSNAAIEDGTIDMTHTFAVGLIQLSRLQSGQVSFCSGVMLAPNLVATARHCVAQLSSDAIACATSTFGGLVPVNDVFVTTDTTISPRGTLIGVSSIVVPSGPGESGVCGNDIALLTLNANIKLAQYVVPVINPPMSDQTVYSTAVTAIGYGITSPTDEAGVTAGERRIKENIELLCIPDDQTFPDCLSAPGATQVLSAGEFVSGDASTCEGDSGSGAYEQASFDKGQWLAFGVLSRGAVSADGATCIQPIYERFDAWGALLSRTAKEAAVAGGYTVPAWAAAAAGLSGSEAGVEKEAGGNTREVPGNTMGEGCSASSSSKLSPGAWMGAVVALLGVAAGARRRGRKRHISAPREGACSQ